MPSGSHWKRTLGRWFLGTPSWIGELDPGVLLVFLHLPKAGGTSLNDLLAHVYGRRFLNVSNHRKAWETRTTDPDGVLCLAGHFKYGWHARLGQGLGRGEEEPGDGIFEGREIRYVTVVREPVDRVKSYYRYVQAAPKHRHHAEAVGLSPREFFEFIEDKGDAEPWDQQFRMMKGLPGDRFHLCAPLDRLGDFVSVLGRAMNWPADLEIPHSNRTDPNRDDGFDEGLVEMIRERSSRDRELYENVGKRFEEGDFPAFRVADSAAGTT